MIGQYIRDSVLYEVRAETEETSLSHWPT